MNRAAVNCMSSSGRELLSFESFIETQERNKVGWDDGVFKVMIDPCKPRQTSREHILERVRSNVKNVQVQALLQGSPENIFQFKATSAPQAVRDKFLKDCEHLESFSEETCCLQKLVDGQQLMAHFFSDDVSCATPSSHCRTYEEKKNHLLKQGAQLRHLYETDKLPCNIAKRRPSQKCSCSQCDFLSSRRAVGGDSNDILYAGGVVLRNEEPVLITDGFSLSGIKNILNVAHQFFEGLSTSFFYLGSKHSFFALHLEDALLWSINYLHFGLPKIWIVIPPSARLLLMYHLCNSGLGLANTSCWNFLGHKNAFPTLKWLEERGIPYKLVYQHPGEAVILYPNAAHFGFNTGWNLAEAINFGTVSWIPDGINAPRCLCWPGKAVHLDMSTLVAGFRPDLLDSFLTSEFIPSQRTDEMIDFFRESLKTKNKSNNEKEQGNKKVKRRKTFSAMLECPAPYCNLQLPLSKKQQLRNHVKRDHRPIIVKCNLIQKTEELISDLENQ